jgi:NAD(P)-dependent dehydrogenase (short-subunit alcohol dehydrogenase family)
MAGEPSYYPKTMNLQPFFQDKVVVITGSARGIGRETARLALAAGARVVVNGRDPASLATTVTSLAAPGRVLAVAADVSTSEGAQALVGQTLEAWGRIDVLVNNAGLSMRGAFGDLTPSTVKTMVEANLLTAVWTTQAALTALRQSRGRVAFISSLAGVRGFPGVSLYSASKMALTALHQSLEAEETRRGVTSSLVYLAFTQNDPEKTVLGADGRPFHHQRTWSVTQVQTAQAILAAIARGKGRTTLTFSGRVFQGAQAWLPGVVDWFVRRSGGKLHHVEEKKP